MRERGNLWKAKSAAVGGSFVAIVMVAHLPPRTLWWLTTLLAAVLWLGLTVTFKMEDDIQVRIGLRDARQRRERPARGLPVEV